MGAKNILEIADKPGMVWALPDAKDSSSQGFQPADVLSGIRSLRAAEQESVGLAREIRTDREAESLAGWADAKGCLEIEKRTPQADDLTGGEHLVTLDASGHFVWKSTHPGKFGFGADVEMVHPSGWRAKPRITVGLVDASPDEYLFRLAMQNELFGDEIRVMGAVRYPQGLSVLTTQPFYHGERTEQPVIDSWFESRGWRRLAEKQGAFYDATKDLLILDALPRNVLTLDRGGILPFDVVVVQPSYHLKSRLGL
jgi:hypothetical protein